MQEPHREFDEKALLLVGVSLVVLGKPLVVLQKTASRIYGKCFRWGAQAEGFSLKALG